MTMIPPLVLLTSLLSLSVGSAPAFRADSACRTRLMGSESHWFAYMEDGVHRGYLGYIETEAEEPDLRRFCFDLAVDSPGEPPWRIGVVIDTRNDRYLTPIRFHGRRTSGKTVGEVQTEIDWQGGQGTLRFSGKVSGGASDEAFEGEAEAKLQEPVVLDILLPVLVPTREFRRDQVLRFHLMPFLDDGRPPLEGELLYLGRSPNVSDDSGETHRFEYRRPQLHTPSRFWVNSDRELVQAEQDGRKMMVRTTRKKAKQYIRRQ